MGIHFTNNKKLIAYIALISAVVFWGIIPPFNKIMLDAYSPMIYVGAGSLVAFLAMLPMSTKSFKLLDKTYLKTALPTGIIWALAEIFYIIGLNYTTPAKAALYENCTVIIVPILLVLMGTKQNVWKFIAAIVCFVGIGIVGFQGDPKELFSFTIGDLLIFLAGVCYGVDIVNSKRFLDNIDAKLYMLIRLAVLAVMATGGAFIFEVVRFSFEWWHLLLLFVLQLIAKAFCWTMRNYGLKHLDANICSLMMPFSAIIAGVISICMGMDALSWQLIVGTILIFIALFMSEIEKPKMLKNK